MAKSGVFGNKMIKKMDFLKIHLGDLIKKTVEENEIEISRICNFIKCTELDVHRMYESKSLNTEVLLRWCKLLEYDFFRLYSQHLILYAPALGNNETMIKKEKKISLPQFKKNIYTKQVIDFILEEISTNQKTKQQVMDRYNIPKTTLYRWISKYGK